MVFSPFLTSQASDPLLSGAYLPSLLRKRRRKEWKNAVTHLTTTTKSPSTPGSGPSSPHLGWDGDNDMLHEALLQLRPQWQGVWRSECGGGLADAESFSESEKPKVCQPPLNRSTEAILPEHEKAWDKVLQGSEASSTPAFLLRPDPSWVPVYSAVTDSHHFHMLWPLTEQGPPWIPSPPTTDPFLPIPGKPTWRRRLFFPTCSTSHPKALPAPSSWHFAIDGHCSSFPFTESYLWARSQNVGVLQDCHSGSSLILLYTCS